MTSLIDYKFSFAEFLGLDNLNEAVARADPDVISIGGEEHSSDCVRVHKANIFSLTGDILVNIVGLI